MSDKTASEAKTQEGPQFEQALEQLQSVVRKLESGEFTLEQSLEQFELGVRLTRACQEQLAAAEQRVELLMKTSPDGQIETKPFPTSR